MNFSISQFTCKSGSHFQLFLIVYNFKTAMPHSHSKRCVSPSNSEAELSSKKVAIEAAVKHFEELGWV